MGVLGEEVSRCKVLGTSLQARVISPSQEANPHGSRSEEELRLLTPRLDFEIRMEGEELWKGLQGWGLPPLPTSPELLGLAKCLRERGQKAVGAGKEGESGERRQVGKVKVFQTCFVSFVFHQGLTG